MDIQYLIREKTAMRVEYICTLKGGGHKKARRGGQMMNLDI
jgi:hypothetical protein